MGLWDTNSSFSRSVDTGSHSWSALWSDRIHHWGRDSAICQCKSYQSLVWVCGIHIIIPSWEEGGKKAPKAHQVGGWYKVMLKIALIPHTHFRWHIMNTGILIIKWFRMRLYFQSLSTRHSWIHLYIECIQWVITGLHFPMLHHHMWWLLGSSSNL